MKCEELLNLVSNNKYLSICDLENELQNIENPPVFIKQGLDSYAYSDCISLLDIYHCEDGFVGIIGIVPNDEYSPEDVDIPCLAEIYVPVPSTEYVPVSKVNDLSFNRGKA